MKSVGATQKILAFLFLLFFSQKIGVELYLHNWLHVNKYEQPESHRASKNISAYSCSCLDDFLTSIEPAKLGYHLGIVSYSSHDFCYKEIISFSCKFFNCLRAPPAQM